MVSRRCCYAERLLHQSIRLITIPVWAVLSSCHFEIRVTPAGAVWCFPCSCRRQRGGKTTSATFPFHLSIRQETPRYPTCTPRFPVRPPPHTCFSFIPHENRARLDRLPFFFREPPLNAGKQSQPAGFKQNDRIRWSPYMTIIRLHANSPSHQYRLSIDLFGFLKMALGKSQ